tara:strand:+ start:1001 stop:3445 length:2445 start_codon:yes stop_codon:yes gene_type:complete
LFNSFKHFYNISKYYKMSLIFLKNDTNSTFSTANDHMKPYDWANNFDTPLVLPVDSQVAYISSTMSRDKVINFTAPQDNLFVQVGPGQLNIPMPLPLTTAPGSTDTWSDVANRMTAFNGLGNSDFMFDGKTGGFTGVYDATTKKFSASLAQRLQPDVQEVWANRGDLQVSVWDGKNDTGMINENGIAGGVSATSAVAGGAGTKWDVGWKQFTLAAGGNGAGDALTYVDDRFSLMRSRTGIKRTCFDPVNPLELGGQVQFRGSMNTGAFGATPRSNSLPYICGLNSLQAINEANGAITGGFINNNTINGTSANYALTPNVVQVRFENGSMIVEIMETQNDYSIGQADLGQLQFGTWGRCEEDPTLPVNNYAPYGMRIIESIDIDTWLTSALNQPHNTGGQATQPYYNLFQADLVANDQNKITIIIRWTTPYTFQVLAGTGFDAREGIYKGTIIAGGNQYAPGTGYDNTYSILYDSKTGGTWGTNLTGDATKSLFIPRYFGDMGLNCYIDRRNLIQSRGNYDVIKCFPDDTTGTLLSSYDATLRGLPLGLNMQTPEIGAFDFLNVARLIPKTSTQILPAIPQITTTALDFNDGTTTASNTGMSDEIPTLVVGPLRQATSIAKFQNWWEKPIILADVVNTWKPINAQPAINIGVILGWIKSTDDGMVDMALNAPNDVSLYIQTGLEDVGESETYQSVHIQLTNLPITGKNGMTSGQTSTIAVIHNPVSSVGIGDLKIYNHYAPVKNWIDLNNFSEMTINYIRAYVSDDANRPATFLKDGSDILIMFRQKPAIDGGVSTQPISKFGLTPATGQTFRVR